MIRENFYIGRIPAMLWGEKSDKVYIYVHGKMSSKESAEGFAEIANSNGYQTISFDLPEHGERIGTDYKCNIVNGIADLTQVGDYVFDHWINVSLFGCSLGAFFSLHAYRNRNIHNCLFQSPIVNMEYLISQMFLWFHITEEELMEKGEIPTPIDTMSWTYYRYVKEHQVDQWETSTHILYGGKDDLQSREVIDAFVNKFNCQLTVAESSEHSFMGVGDNKIVEAWMRNNL
ncbi:MAG: alpha/beta superfamily hydrolase [Herbinix sp.]|jgi:surfactin synthase thioesterase subunit|nr:alpha/beta superfamily hydrolase [Herbinix sp.]